MSSFPLYCGLNIKMSPIGSYVWKLGLEMTMMLGNVMEPFEHGIQLADTGMLAGPILA